MHPESMQNIYIDALAKVIRVLEEKNIKLDTIVIVLNECKCIDSLSGNIDKKRLIILDSFNLKSRIRVNRGRELYFRISRIQYETGVFFVDIVPFTGDYRKRKYFILNSQTYRVNYRFDKFSVVFLNIKNMAI